MPSFRTSSQYSQYNRAGQYGLILPVSAFEPEVHRRRPKFQYRGRLYYKTAAVVNERGLFPVQAVWGKNRPGAYTELHPDDPVREWFPAPVCRTTTSTYRLTPYFWAIIGTSSSASSSYCFSAAAGAGAGTTATAVVS